MAAAAAPDVARTICLRRLDGRRIFGEISQLWNAAHAFNRSRFQALVQRDLPPEAR